jgi:hypothetical protein
MSKTKDTVPAVDASRRATLRKLGRFAAVTPPAVALLLAAESRPANALTSPPTDTTDGAD